MGVPVSTGVDGRLAITEAIGQKTVAARAVSNKQEEV